MKKARKFLSSFIILIIFAIIVFFFGWIQFLVKPGTCAIMTSKTSGLYKEAIVSGKFLWRWERLLPTNVQLETFSLKSYESNQVVQGFLPSGDIYAKEFDQNLDFSYKFDMNISLNANPQMIYELYKSNKIQNDDDLQKFLEQSAKSLSFIIAQEILKSNENNSDYVQNQILSENFINQILSKNNFSDIQINSVELKNSKIPDVKFYNTIKNFYDSYLENIKSKIDKKAEEQAQKILDEDRNLKRLEQFAELIKKYPELNDLAKNGDLTSLMNALR